MYTGCHVCSHTHSVVRVSGINVSTHTRAHYSGMGWEGGNLDGAPHGSFMHYKGSESV